MDAVAAATAPVSAPAASVAPADTKAAVPTKTSSSHEHGRVPLIKFVGKRDKTKKSHLQAATPAAPAAAAASAPAFKPLKEGNGVHFTTLQGAGLFGRPPLTQREMDAIESGGAIF